MLRPNFIKLVETIQNSQTRGAGYHKMAAVSLCVSSGFKSKVCSSVESFLKLFTSSLKPFLRKLSRPLVNTEGIMLQWMWHLFFYSPVHTLSLSAFYSQELGTAYLFKSNRVCNQEQKQWLGLSKDYQLLSHVTISGT